MNINDKIIEILKDKDCPPQYPVHLMEALGVSKDQERIFNSILQEMVDNGQLVVTRKKKYALPEELGFIVGKLQGNAKGFGFLIPDDQNEDDVFISAENLHGAMNNDRIMVRILKSDKVMSSGASSREGEVVKIIEHANKLVIGTFEDDKYFGFVVPDDPKINYDIFIPKNLINGARSGCKVVTEIVKWPSERRNPEGKIIEILGHKDEAGVDVLSIIKQYGIPEEFPEDVLRFVKKVSQKVLPKDMEGRLDLRDLKLFTIDGADARDFDDAVSIEVLPNGNFKLGVHIADVSHYVNENSGLDKEAYNRGTSIYLVDRVIPMLPKELSNGICSLNPNEDRLALSVFMEIDNEGGVRSYSIHESIINSKARMVYEDVTKVLENKDERIIEQYADYIDDLKYMEKLCKILSESRIKRGSIDFDLNETQIILDDKGKPVDVRPYERGISNRIIEEFMIICNETIAEYMFWNNTPFMYRVHEEPDITKMLDFNEFIHNFGYQLKGIGGGEIHPKVLQTLLKKISGTREERIISAVMLRSLQKAKYSHQNLGHFGLAAKYYCHFTSPIRRYPDLIVHRIIKAYINGDMNERRVANLAELLPSIADHCSKREIAADEVERETDDLKKAEFMLDKVGMEFDGIISGVTNYGIYVQLENTVEGLVRLSTIEDDYYSYDESHYCIIGERTRKIYRLGDYLRIKVIKVDLASRNIDFILAEDF